MPGKKISPLFVICAGVGVLLIAFAVFGTVIVGAKVDEPDGDKAEIQIQLATCLNFIVAGLAFVLIGLGFQMASGTRAPMPQVPPGGWPQQPPGHVPGPQQAPPGMPMHQQPQPPQQPQPQQPQQPPQR
ncbi:hypothetical protein BJF79_29630 [Actinomadura sp. CNU-125]|uniref:hypothetical protein n=1 Tax=Actinomadura sp. CNU-125 TaxID=1904961 RepID=UPI0009623EAF|nr:hypothetical protein [Actinomadura sp. CNU-125]OLT37356.1 hypothetical protein BJF79_29630 [Actinomadura sp. CNU-125]